MGSGSFRYLTSLFNRRVIAKKNMSTFQKKTSQVLELPFPNAFYFSQEGYCGCCNQDVIFESKTSWLRDWFFCSNCASMPRERALIKVIEESYPNWRNLLIHESSPAYRGVSEKMQKECMGYTSSQYFPGQPFGSMVQNYRNENLEEQTFPDESFDLIVTQDVMEHIYNPEKAFSEIARTLKRGGAHIFTVPMINKHMKTEVWATLDPSGNPLFLKEPEYHSNPVNPLGSPVTMHWGFDIVNFIREKSGLETTIVHLDDIRLGIRAEYIEVLVSRKN